MKLLKGISNFIGKLETVFIITSLAIMVTLSFTQVILRNLAHFSFLWAEDLSRHLVLWVGLLGASLATKDDKHISIDVITRTLPPLARSIVKTILDLIGFFVCSFLAKYSLDFVLVEREFGEASISLKLPVWILEIIIPIAFAIIAFRFLVDFIDKFLNIIKVR